MGALVIHPHLLKNQFNFFKSVSRKNDYQKKGLDGSDEKIPRARASAWLSGYRVLNGSTLHVPTRFDAMVNDRFPIPISSYPLFSNGFSAQLLKDDVAVLFFSFFSMG